MRNCKKTRLLVALLVVALTFNVASLAFAEGVEVNFELVEVPNGLEAADEGLDGFEFAADQPADMGTVETLAAEQGMMIEPGKYFTYNGKPYKVLDNATNVASTIGGANGGFDTRPSVTISDQGADVLLSVNSDGWDYNTSDGHNSPGCYEFKNGRTIWRHTFENKMYVMSSWWKFTGNDGIADDYRHVAGAVDVDTGSQHTIEFGRNVDITHDWQQDLCVFNGNPADNKFFYIVHTGGGTVYIDDLVIYEVEPIDPFSIDGYVIEDPNDWNANLTNIPSTGKFNHIITYTTNMTGPIVFNGVVVVFKDNKLYRIYQKEVNSRTATLINGDLTSETGAVSIEFEVPEGEDVSRFSYVSYLSDASNPFYVYGQASGSYAQTIYGAQE